MPRTLTQAAEASEAISKEIDEDGETVVTVDKQKMSEQLEEEVAKMQEEMVRIDHDEETLKETGEPTMRLR